MEKIEKIQRRYYTQTAHVYDGLHGCRDTEHQRALAEISASISMMRLSSMLDVGCGTGRGVKHFLTQHPSLLTVGVEPVPALISQAVTAGRLPPETFVCARGQHLPFADGSFDAVCELGVLHHVQKPGVVVQEMTRVARRAVFLSDENRFAHGTMISRLAKLCLYKLNLFGAAYYLKTRGKSFRFSREDGVAFSYSVYDAFDHLADWADYIFLIPTGSPNRKSWFHPLLTSFHLLLCALKES